MAQPIDAIRDLIERFCPDPRTATSVSGLTLFRSLEPTIPVASVYEPRLCVVLQGCKRVLLGSQVHVVDTDRCFVATVDLPVTAMVAEASTERPHLALTLALNRDAIAELLAESRLPRQPDAVSVGLAVGWRPDALLAPLLRLVSLLETPEDIGVLAPMAEREILYRLLRSEFGGVLASYADVGTHLFQIGRATKWLRDHYAEPFSIEDLAAEVGMSVTSFHRHFKAATTMSPLRYRTEIRLREAQRRLLSGGEGAGAVGFAVGYGSQSQFTRDYRRRFGRPPLADAIRLRGGDVTA